jgi:hypothetical protein
LAGQWQRRQKSADRLVDLWMGWLDGRLSGMKGRKQVLGFMDTELRKDVANLAQYAWLSTNEARLTSPSANGLNALTRLCAYLLKRGYIEAADLPAITRAVSHPKDKDQLAAAAAVGRSILERKVGLKDERTLAALKSLLDDPASSGKLFRAYLRHSKEYKAALKAWRKGPRPQPDAAQEPDPLSVVGQLADEAFHFQLFSFNAATESALSVSLAVDGEVLGTNGEFDAKTGTITWKGSFDTDEEGKGMLPAVCYATWCREDRGFQSDHFGKVALSGEQLQSYCLWRDSLNETEAKEWDAFLSGLKPGAGAAAQLRGFRFSTETADQKEPSYADKASGPIVKALEGKP